MRTIRCIVVDDEPKAINVLMRYIERIPDVQLVQTFRNPVEALAFLQENTIDLVFCDINMPHLSGTDFIRAIGDSSAVIFTTAYQEYAVESYTLNAVDYLLKPIGFERFTQAIHKVRALHFAQRVHQPNDIVLLKSGSEVYRMRLDDIYYLEKDANYFKVFTATTCILIRENMSDIFRVLPSSTFVRTHKSFLVNINKIQKIESAVLIVQGTKIPIGRSYREALLRQLGIP